MIYAAKWRLTVSALMYAGLWVIVFIPYFAQPAKAQCNQWCLAQPGKCHLVRADAYLGHGRSVDELCWDSFKEAARCLPYREALKRGIAELKVAAADPGVSPDDLREYRVEIAESTMNLGHELIRNNELVEGGRLLDEAAEEFRVELAIKAHSELEKYQNHRIVVGLLRCGHPLDALAATSSIDSADQDRLYLKAVALTQLGERKPAAKVYEQWIRAGCESDFDLILNDDKGLIWDLGRRVGRSPCASLPVEVRSTLEALRDQFGHPNNLPAHNSIPMQASLFGRAPLLENEEWSDPSCHIPKTVPGADKPPGDTTLLHKKN